MPIMDMLLRVVLWMFIIRIVFSLMRGMMIYRRMRQGGMQLQQDRLAPSREPEKKPEPAEMVKDSCCGNLVDKEKAYSTYIQDTLHYFCSWECRQRYLSEAE